MPESVESSPFAITDLFIGPRPAWAVQSFSLVRIVDIIPSLNTLLPHCASAPPAAYLNPPQKKSHSSSHLSYSSIYRFQRRRTNLITPSSNPIASPLNNRNLGLATGQSRRLSLHHILSRLHDAQPIRLNSLMRSLAKHERDEATCCTRHTSPDPRPKGREARTAAAR